MAEVPPQIASALDSSTPTEPEDYTDWEIDPETDQRINDLLANDVNSDNDWNLKGDG